MILEDVRVYLVAIPVVVRCLIYDLPLQSLYLSLMLKLLDDCHLAEVLLLILKVVRLPLSVLQPSPQILSVHLLVLFLFKQSLCISWCDSVNGCCFDVAGGESAQIGQIACPLFWRERVFTTVDV